MAAIWEMIDADTRRARLWALYPSMTIEHAEAIVHACACRDRAKGERAFTAALDALDRRALRRAA